MSPNIHELIGRDSIGVQKKKLYCAILYCTVLYCTVLYFAVLYCTVLLCTALYCTVLYCTALYCTVLYCTALYCAVVYCTILYCSVLYCAVLYCTVLYCSVLYAYVVYLHVQPNAPTNEFISELHSLFDTVWRRDDTVDKCNKTSLIFFCLRFLQLLDNYTETILATDLLL